MDLLFNDTKQQIKDRFIVKGWVTLVSFGDNLKNVQQGSIYSALVSPDKLENSLNNRSWELRYGSGKPGITSFYKDGNKITKYYRFSEKGYEPLIYYREEFGTRDNYLELSEEFRLYHNLYEDFKSHQDKEYIYINGNGDEEVVVKICENEATIKLKFLKDYISARKLNLLIYFDLMRFNEKNLEELHLDEIENDYSSSYFYYNHLIQDASDMRIKNYKTHSRIMGKCLIENIKDYKPSVWGNIDKNDEYADFIIGYDEDGVEKLNTCEEDKLSNYFGKNPESPHFVTPVYFDKEVLKKYYDNPSKYTVNDGYISCQSVWSLRLDNDCKDYIIVMLGDLGRLHYKEQLYWKSFNIPPREGFSHTGLKRFFEGESCDPENPDLNLKMRMSQFSKKWNLKFGWDLFKPLSSKDVHYFKSLHLLTSEGNEKEFDEQILALTKIFIDSLNEKEIVKGVVIEKENARGLDKLDYFLRNRGISNSEMIKFLRNLQSLRSATVAHRRSPNRKDTIKVLNYFEIGNKPLNSILEKIFIDLISTLNTIEKKLVEEHVA